MTRPVSRPLPDNLRPAALLPAGGAKLGELYAGSFARGSRATGTRRVIPRGTLRKLGGSEFVAFVQTTRTGTLCLFVRHGGLGFHAAHDAEPWFTLVRSAHIKPRLGMELLVEQVVLSEFAEIFVAVAREVGVEIRA